MSAVDAGCRPAEALQLVEQLESAIGALHAEMVSAADPARRARKQDAIAAVRRFIDILSTTVASGFYLTDETLARGRVLLRAAQLGGILMAADAPVPTDSWPAWLNPPVDRAHERAELVDLVDNGLAVRVAQPGQQPFYRLVDLRAAPLSTWRVGTDG